MTAVLREDPPPLDPAPPLQLIRVAQHCLEKEPAERFQSASDVAFALEGLSGHSETGVQTIPARGRAPSGALR